MFTFKPLLIKQLPLLFSWLSLPHVSAWWRETKDYNAFIKKYENRISSNNIGPYLMYHDEKPIGFAQWYDVTRWPLGKEKFPQDTYGMDLFVADSDYVGKGYGSTIITQFIDTIIMPMKPKKIIVDPEIANERAIHVYQKAGFKKNKIIETIDETSIVTVQLMEMIYSYPI